MEELELVTQGTVSIDVLIEMPRLAGLFISAKRIADADMLPLLPSLSRLKVFSGTPVEVVLGENVQSAELRRLPPGSRVLATESGEPLSLELHESPGCKVVWESLQRVTRLTIDPAASESPEKVALLRGLVMLSLDLTSRPANFNWLNALSKIESLQLACSEHCETVTHCDGLESLPHLRYLSLCWNGLAIHALRKSKTLRTLELSACLNIDGFDTLPRIAELNTLDCSYSAPVNEADWMVLSECGSLICLSISDTDVTTLEWLKGLPRLRDLNISRSSVETTMSNRDRMWLKQLLARGGVVHTSLPQRDTSAEEGSAVEMDSITQQED